MHSNPVSRLRSHVACDAASCFMQKKRKETLRLCELGNPPMFERFASSHAYGKASPRCCLEAILACRRYRSWFCRHHLFLGRVYQHGSGLLWTGNDRFGSNVVIENQAREQYIVSTIYYLCPRDMIEFQCKCGVENFI